MARRDSRYSSTQQAVGHRPAIEMDTRTGHAQDSPYQASLGTVPGPAPACVLSQRSWGLATCRSTPQERWLAGTRARPARRQPFTPRAGARCCSCSTIVRCLHFHGSFARTDRLGFVWWPRINNGAARRPACPCRPNIVVAAYAAWIACIRKARLAPFPLRGARQGYEQPNRNPLNVALRKDNTRASTRSARGGVHAIYI